MDKLSILVPAFNEEGAIQTVLSDLQSVMEGMKIPYEVIAVDDGSTDRTADLARATGVTLISHPENRGYGAALKAGIQRATGERILTIDGDGSYPASEIPKLLEEAGNYDMVVGARKGIASATEVFRRPALWLLGALASYLVGTRIPDINSGMRVFRREVAFEYFTLLPENFSFTMTLTLAMLSDGWLVKYIPIGYRKRVGRSKIRPLRDGCNFILLILRTIIYFNPLKVFLPIAFFLVALGAGVLGWRVIFRADIAQFEILTILLGIQIGMMGLLADLMVRRSRWLGRRGGG